MKYRHLNLKYALINCFYYMLTCGSMGFANNYLQYKEFGTSLIGVILTAVSIGTLAGQTGMAAMTTIGNLFASFCGGMMISGLGVHTALLIGTVISVIGTLLMIFGIQKIHKDQPEKD